MLYAWHGIRMIKGGKLPDASGLPYLALAGVGVFSAIFHATLWVETQRCECHLRSLPYVHFFRVCLDTWQMLTLRPR